MPTPEIIHIFEKSESVHYLWLTLEIIQSGKASLGDRDLSVSSCHLIKNDFRKQL